MALPKNGAVFSLRNASSSCYLGIEANVDYAGAAVVAIPASVDIVPKWLLREEQDAHYLVNADFPTMCMNVAYESKSVGATIQQWLCNGGRSELWTLVPTLNGRFSVLNKNSGLAVGAAYPVAGSPIVQMDTAAHELAQWKIVSHGSEDLQTSDAGGIARLATESNAYAPTPADEIMYNIYVPIYSQSGKLRAVTQDLTRIASLGFSTILIMPIHPIGIPIGNHPAVESPYAVSDYFTVAPSLGQLSDFAALVSQAHILGLKIIMDVVLNHTAWNHPLITQRPHYYVHTDRRKHDPYTVSHAFWFEDVAQLDYKSGMDVRQYMINMLLWWLKEHNVDGFRFDTADNPYGNDRMIPSSTWLAIGHDLKAVNPGVILLGECTNPELSLRPFNMDYNNYSLQPAISLAAKSQDARGLSKAFDQLKSAHPPGMLHTSIMQTWDMDLDLNMYGGPDGTMAAAVFNFTIEGVPMLFAGEEVANDRGGVNTHTKINWNGPLSTRFRDFYSQLGMLRRTKFALRRGSTTWLRVPGGGSGLIVFLRTWHSEQCLIAVNFSMAAVQGVVREVVTGPWTDVTPFGVLRATSHPLPPSVKLGPWDFVVFARGRGS